VQDWTGMKLAARAGSPFRIYLPCTTTWLCPTKMQRNTCRPRVAAPFVRQLRYPYTRIFAHAGMNLQTFAWFLALLPPRHHLELRRRGRWVAVLAAPVVELFKSLPAASEDSCPILPGELRGLAYLSNTITAGCRQHARRRRG